MSKHPELDKLLETNKTFCMFPWIHLYVNTDGAAYPCCTTLYENPIGNVRESSIEELWNSPELKEVRKKLLAGEIVEGCANCYRHESTGSGGFSFRNFANNEFGQHFDLTKETLEDGYLPGMHLKYFDVRFSNLCNFKCRTCGDMFSSTWAAESVKQGYGQYPGVTHASNHDPSLLEQFKPHLGNLEMLYFAGGEPLMTPEHWQILEFLIENNSTNVTLRYNSNCSKLHFKDLYIVDLWNHFDKVEFYGSLDSFGSRAEYMRKGTDWSIILKNLKEIKQKCKSVEMSFNCVVSVLNVWALPEFFTHMSEEGIFDLQHTNGSLYKLINPDYYNLNNLLPVALKDEIKEKLDTFIETLPVGSIKNNLTDISAFINLEEPKEQHIKTFVQTTKHLDNIREEKFINAFPELKEWYIGLQHD